jgi:hypothetical protein
MKYSDTHLEIEKTRLQIYRMVAGWLSISYVLGIGFAVYEIYNLIF